MNCTKTKSLTFTVFIAKIWWKRHVWEQYSFSVVKNKEKYSGITIHFVNEEYDSGAIIFQYKYELKKSETVESLSNEIQKIEHAFFLKLF